MAKKQIKDYNELQDLKTFYPLTDTFNMRVKKGDAILFRVINGTKDKRMYGYVESVLGNMIYSVSREGKHILPIYVKQAKRYHKIFYFLGYF